MTVFLIIGAALSLAGVVVWIGMLLWAARVKTGATNARETDASRRDRDDHVKMVGRTSTLVSRSSHFGTDHEPCDWRPRLLGTFG